MADIIGITFTKASPNMVDLSAEGTLDWARWMDPNPAAYIRSNDAGTPPNIIMTFSSIGGSKVSNTVLGPVTYTWSNGTPVAVAPPDNMPYVFTFGEGNGFRISAKGYDLEEDLDFRLYVYNTGNLTAQLNAALNGPGGQKNNNDFVNNTQQVQTGYYDVIFNASVLEDTLTVNFTDFQSMGGIDAVGIGAATLREIVLTPEPSSAILLSTVSLVLLGYTRSRAGRSRSAIRRWRT
jgi:hypothetical protein